MLWFVVRSLRPSLHRHCVSAMRYHIGVGNDLPAGQTLIDVVASFPSRRVIGEGLSDTSSTARSILNIGVGTGGCGLLRALRSSQRECLHNLAAGGNQHEDIICTRDASSA